MSNSMGVQRVGGWLLLAALNGFAGLACAQASPALALPDLNLLTNGQVNAVLRQPDGGVVLGGEFLSVAGVPRNNIARLLPNGNLDPNWNPSADTAVFTLALDNSGALLVGGRFTEIGGLPRVGIAKLSSTGVVDPDWHPSVDTSVSTIALDNDGSVFVGGAFTEVDGLPRTRIAKISNATGVVDPTWNPSADATVFTLVADSEGSVFAGGNFTTINGLPRSRIAKLSASGSGVPDPDWIPSANNPVFELVVDGDGALLVGGQFTQINGEVRNRIAKLDRSGAGTADPNWRPSANNTVRALTVDSGGAVYAGGQFSHIDGQPHGRIVKLAGNGTGAADASWNPSANDTVWAMEAGDDGALLLGGVFTDVSGQPRLGFASLDPLGELAGTTADAERGGTVSVMAQQPDGGVIVSGTFSKANGLPRSNLLRLRPDRTLDPDWNPSPNNVVTAVVADSTGAVFVGGQFTSIGGQPRNRIAKLAGSGTGTADPDWNPSANNTVQALAIGSDGMLFAGGFFTDLGGQPRNRIAKLSSDTGVVDPTWNPSADNTVFTLVADSNGSLFASGTFTLIGGQSRSRLAKLSIDGSGAVDPDWVPLADNTVFTLVTDSNGSLFAGGTFSQINGQPRSNIAKLSGSGTGAVDSWNPSANATVRTLAVDSSGAVFAGGQFTEIGGQVRSRIAKLDGSGTGAADSEWDPSANNTVFALIADPSGAVFAGGSFTEIGGQLRLGLAALPSSVLSVDASLSALQPATGTLTPVFSPSETLYVMLVDNATSSLAFTASASDAQASLTINGQPLTSGMPSAPIPLSVGVTRVTIRITAGDGVTQRAYDVYVARLSSEPVALALSIQSVSAPFRGGELRQYRITVTNVGQQMASGVQANVPAPNGLSDLLWTCEAPGGCTPNAGANGIMTSFDLGSGQAAVLDLSGMLVPGVSFVDIRAGASTAGGAVSTQTMISDPANGIGVHKNGFE